MVKLHYKLQHSSSSDKSNISVQTIRNVIFIFALERFLFLACTRQFWLVLVQFHLVFTMPVQE